MRIDTIRSVDLNETVTAPGRTEALRQARVRTPFAGHLVSLDVTDGDRVSSGEEVAQVVSTNSEAALQGARQMLAQARSAADSADARRAVELAREQMVRRPLMSPADGVVLSHQAEQGDYLDQGEVIVTIAEAGAVFFNAQVTQGDLGRIAPGQHAIIDLPAAGAEPVGAVVHGVLPSASSGTLSAPVRLDFSPPHPGLAVGLFGNATIVTGVRRDAVIVPAEAVLRNDVSGTSRVALMQPDGTAHWVAVQTGQRVADTVQITSPSLEPGRPVIVGGQVGLPEGARVQVEP